jgi:hypothetical protein
MTALVRFALMLVIVALAAVAAIIFLAASAPGWAFAALLAVYMAQRLYGKRRN